MKYIFSLIMALGFSLLYGQSINSYNLCSQLDIDSIPSNIVSIDTLLFGSPSVSSNDTCDINNLNPIHNVERINYLSRISSMPNLRDLQGLENLRYIGIFFNSNFYSQNQSSLSISLDTIETLHHSFTNNSRDLNSYSNVKYIQNLNLSGFGSAANLNPNVKRSVRGLSISGNRDIDLGQLIQKNTNILSYAAIARCRNVSINNVNIISQVDRLFLGECIDCDLDLLTSSRIGTLLVGFDLGTIVSYPQITSISCSLFLEGLSGESIGDYLPEISSIGGGIYIRNNSNLMDLNIFRGASLDLNTCEESDYDTPYLVEVINNPMLDSCNLDVICDALRINPNLVRIENNGAACTMNNVMEYCGISNTSYNRYNRIKIYPNPVGDYLYLDGITDFNYRIINLRGQIIMEGKSNEDAAINAEHLAPSFYILSIIADTGSSYNYKFSKV